jgi:hypothetical protein
VLDGVYGRTEGEPALRAAPIPTRAELEGLLDKIIVHLTKMLTRQGYLVEAQGFSYSQGPEGWRDCHISGAWIANGLFGDFAMTAPGRIGSDARTSLAGHNTGHSLLPRFRDKRVAHDAGALVAAFLSFAR